VDLLGLLLKLLAEPLGKILLKAYLGETGEAIGGGLLEVARGKLKDHADQREAQRQFQGIADQIVKRVLPLFEQGSRQGEIHIESVAGELANTLEARISAEFFLTHDLDPPKLTDAFRAARPLPQGQFSAAEEALYDRALVETVRYLCQTAARLPRFQEALAARSLQQLRHIDKDVEETLESVGRIESLVRSLGGGEQSQRYEADYRQAVVRNLDYVELFGADISPEAKRHSLSVAYISLSLAATLPGRRAELQTLPAEDVVRSLGPDAGRLLIRGEAGSGKSTLLRWVALHAADPDSSASGAGVSPLYEDFRRRGRRRAARMRDLGEPAEHADLADDWRRCVPFLIRIRDCPGGRLPKPQDFPDSVAKEIGGPPPEWVLSVLDDDRALILIDGIDEVPHKYRESVVRKDIAALVGAYPRNYFVISTRPAVPDNWLADLDFREAAINPMSDVDKGRFIDKWHAAVGRELERQGRGDAKLAALAEQLKTMLDGNPSLSRLAANPLLCAMICALHRDRSQKLPESQAELCEALCHMLLHRREYESGLDISEFPEPYRKLSYEQKRALVQELAHYMVRNGETVVEREQADNIIAGTLEHFPGHSGSDAEAVCACLVERSGVIREARPGAIDFIHNTIRDFLAADRFVEDRDYGCLVKHMRDDAWRPVILFAVGTRTRGFASELLGRMLGESSKAPKGAAGAAAARGGQVAPLAIQCRAVALHLDPTLEQRLAALADELLPPDKMSTAEAVAACGDSVVPMLRYRARLNARQAAASVRALRLIGTRAAREALKGYGGDRRRTVVDELAQAIDPLQIEIYREQVCRGERLPAGIGPQVRDLSPLAGLANLKQLDLRNTSVSDIGPLAGLTDLQQLSLGRTWAEFFAWAEELGRPRELYLGGPSVSDVGPLAGLTNLQRLILSGTSVSDVGPLAGLTNLQELSLSHTSVSDVGPLTGLTNLQELVMFRTSVSDLGPLAGLTHLQKLNLSGTSVSDLGPLGGLTNLQELSLSQTSVSDVGPLGGLTNLQELSLSQTSVSDVGPLAGLTHLQKLNLSGTSVSDLGPLAGLTKLQQLYLTYTSVSDLGPLAGLKKLTILGP